MGLRAPTTALRSLTRSQMRTYSTPSIPPASPFAPRHLISIADLTPTELTSLVRNAHSHKRTIKSGSIPKHLLGALTGKTVAMMFSKRSTRTRISTEGAVVTMGGHPMFLGKDDIQLGVNESLYDTAVVISSMVSCIVARVGPHSDITSLAKHSTVPVINALSDKFHPMQTIADLLTIHEAFPSTPGPGRSITSGLGLERMKIAWVGDASNVLFDLAIGAAKLGIDVAVATPKGYEIPAPMKEIIQGAGSEARSGGKLIETHIPEEAVKDADVIVTDTWVSMGQEAEKAQKVKAFEGFQVTPELAQRGGAKAGWKFMHCLPRHQEEVNDEVFYSPSSLVFPEAENRLWAAISALEAFGLSLRSHPVTITWDIYPIANHYHIMDVAYNRHSPSSRRSHPSLNHLSLAPLTPRFPITDPDSLPSPPPSHTHPRTSYIEPRSTPTTPSILSRSPSRTRLRAGAHKSKSTHTLTALTSLAAPVPKSKSSVSIGHLSSRPPRYASAREDSEWLMRAGALIASSTQESKGQSWLATRSSSTSLVDAGDEEGEEDGVGEGEVADDEFSPVLSRRGSGSRFASARSSRRGSRVGSRVELGMSVRESMTRGEGAFVEGPDFVDGVEEDEGEGDGEEEVDERELRRLTREKGFGLGGWVDRFIGWSLFRNEDDERVESDGELDDRLAEGDELGSEGRRKTVENERVVRAPVDERIEEFPPPEDGDGSWQDAAWLLSVASKMIL